MGCGLDAAIVAVAAVRFDPATGQIGDTFYRDVTLDTRPHMCLPYGSDWCGKTEGAIRPLLTTSKMTTVQVVAAHAAPVSLLPAN
jgi:hypothetical protein